MDPLSDGTSNERSGRGALSRLFVAPAGQPELVGEARKEPYAVAPIQNTHLLSGGCKGTTGLAPLSGNIRNRGRLSHYFIRAQAAAGGGVGSPMV